jgi:hypothetical protein
MAARSKGNVLLLKPTVKQLLLDIIYCCSMCGKNQKFNGSSGYIPSPDGSVGSHISN